MNTANGWIKLYRCLLDDPLWQCSTNEQKVILVTLLLMANHAERKWQWQGRPYICRPGQMITSAQSIAEKAGPDISRQNVRTTLKRLEKMGFLTIQSTKVNTLITICNWEHYQAKPEWINQDANHPFTNDSPSFNQDLTTNKNVKNEKNAKNIYMRDNVYLSFQERERRQTDEAFQKAKAEFLRRAELEEKNRFRSSEEREIQRVREANERARARFLAEGD